MNFREEVEKFAEGPLTRQLILHLLKTYKRPNDKIAELVKKGELVTLKNGLYITGSHLNIQRPEPFLVANHLWGPSYVSVETALSYWGWISERVYEICSLTIKAAKSYHTPIGRFRYFHAALPYYSFGIRIVSLTPRQVVLMASPEKALCDTIINTSGLFLRSNRQVRAYLLEDLRIDEDQLKQMDIDAIESWIVDAPKKNSLSMLVKTIKSF